MKKVFFNPCRIAMGKVRLALRLAIFGRHRGVNIMNFMGGEDDDDDDGTEGAKLLRKIKKTVAKELATRATKDEVKEIIAQMGDFLPDKEGKTGFPLEALRAMADEKTGVMKALTDQGLELQKLRTEVQSKVKDLSVRSQCEKFITDNKDAIAKLRSGIKVDLPEFELNLRAAATTPMLPSTVMPGGSTYLTRFEIDPTINQPLRPDPIFWDFIKKGSTNAETYVWVNKKPTDGAAGWIGPGQYKPAISFTIEAENSKAKKIAVNEKMATELLEDIDGFTSWVETELKYMLYNKVNEVLMTGVESSTQPAGIQSLSIPYNAATGAATTNANIWDAIKSCVMQLRVSLFKGPIVTFINPVDLGNAVMTKAQNQGQLFIPPVTGSTIVEDVNMPLGYIQVAAMDYYKILIYKAFRMMWGWENDDFTHNLVTVIAEMRIHQFHSENYDGFAIYDTLENIIAAIDVAPAQP